MLYVQVRARGGGTLDNRNFARAGFKRFTGDDKALTIAVNSGPPTPAGLANRLQLNFWTTDDDLRGGNDNINVVVNLTNGQHRTFNNVNASQRWADNTQTTVNLTLNPAVRPQDIASVTISDTFGGGMGGDNWNMGQVQILAEGNGVDKQIGWNGYKRFTGSDKTLTIPTHY